MNKNNIPHIEKILKKEKCVAMIAPSFAAEFDYPAIIQQLKDLGFDKVVELTFGAKMVNREYHEKLKKNKKLSIASPCPGIIKTILEKYPKYEKNILCIDSPMIAMGKICKKYYPKHKIIFLSPCHFKKIEAEKTEFVDYVIDYLQLRDLFLKYNIKKKKGNFLFDKFYNDYTKIYPLAGGLGKTAHLKGILKKEEIVAIDGIKKVMCWLDNPNPNIKFLDVLFCAGGCIGGPCTNKKLTILQKRKRILDYLEKSKSEDIPEDRKGLIKKAEGIKFSGKCWFK